jgi:hypothetical protein
MVIDDPQVLVTEGGGGGAGYLQEGDVVLMLRLIRAGRSHSGGSAKGRAAVALEAHRSCGKECWSGRKLNCKGRRAPADHGAAKATLDWGSGGVWAPVDGDPKARRRSGGRWRSEQRNRGRKCVCNMRSSVLETPGRARV